MANIVYYVNRCNYCINTQHIMARQSAKKSRIAVPVDGAVPNIELILVKDNSEMNPVDTPLPLPGIVSPQADTPDMFADVQAPADVIMDSENRDNSAAGTEVETQAEEDDEEEDGYVINEDRLWRDDGWTARVISNDEDDGWAVEMTRDGEREPTLIGPWTMGRDKKNPKPMDKPAFYTLVKTANEFRRRTEQQLQAQLHKSIWIDGEAGTIKVTLDIVPDDDFPYADLKAWDDNKELLAKTQVAASFRLNAESAEKWISSGYGRPH